MQYKYTWKIYIYIYFIAKILSNMQLSKNIKTYEFKLSLLISFIILVLIYFFDYAQLTTSILIFTSVILICLAIFLPSKLIFLSKIWKKIALILSYIISPIITFLLFFLIFSPYGIVLKFFGRDPLMKKKANSSWTSNSYDREINFDKEY